MFTLALGVPTLSILASCDKEILSLRSMSLVDKKDRGSIFCHLINTDGIR
jgi:hypothetical protein